MGSPFDPWGQLVDHAGRKCLIDETAQAGVGRAVGIEHVLCQQAIERGLGGGQSELFGGQRLVNVFDVAAVVAQRFGDICIAGEKPHAGGAVGTHAAEDRLMVAQPGVSRIGIGFEFDSRQEGRPRGGHSIHCGLKLCAYDRGGSWPRAAGRWFGCYPHAVEVLKRL